MLKILTKIDKSQGYRKFDGNDFYKFDSPCILAGASVYLEISLSDILPNTSGLDYLRMPFVFVPIANHIKVPEAGVSSEIYDMVPGILKEMKASRILENMDLAVQAVNDILPDPIKVVEVADSKNYPNFRLVGDLDYYSLNSRYKINKELQNSWEGLHKISWFGQDLYVCINLRDDNCYLTIMSSQEIKNQKLLVQLMNYKYAFKRYGIKTTSN
jgi:hypothetical protein